jgi:hypothetical protein
MKCGQATFLRERLAGGNNDLISRDVVGTFIDTTAAKQALGHCQIRLVIQIKIIRQDMLRQRHLTASDCRLTLKRSEGGTILATGTALDAFFQLIFNPLEGIYILLFHRVKPFTTEARRHGEILNRTHCRKIC